MELQNVPFLFSSKYNFWMIFWMVFWMFFYVFLGEIISFCIVTNDDSYLFVNTYSEGNMYKIPISDDSTSRVVEQIVPTNAKELPSQTFSFSFRLLKLKYK